LKYKHIGDKQMLTSTTVTYTKNDIIQRASHNNIKTLKDSELSKVIYHIYGNHDCNLTYWENIDTAIMSIRPDKQLNLYEVEFKEINSCFWHIEAQSQEEAEEISKKGYVSAHGHFCESENNSYDFINCIEIEDF
jgi:hypothetical protein